jgi:hypothetical protein
MATWSVKYRLAPPNDAKLRNIHVEADNPLRAVSHAEARIPSDAVILGYRMDGLLCSVASTPHGLAARLIMARL